MVPDAVVWKVLPLGQSRIRSVYGKRAAATVSSGAYAP